MKKYICIVLFLALTLTGCSINMSPKIKPKTKPKINTTENLSIVTTNKFLYYMTKDIVKNNHDIDYMLKTEDEQWSYQYTEDALGNIANKDLFIYFDGSFEPWITDFLGDIKGGKVTNINCSRGAKITKLNNPIEYGDYKLTDNPYYWMNPDNYKIIMSNIKNAIEEKDPQNRKMYESNFDDNMKQLSKLQDQIEDYNEQTDQFVFVTYGDTFNYMAQGMGIKLINIYDDTKISEVKEKLDEASEDAKGVIFLSGGETLPQNCRNLINEYSMKQANVSNYSYETDYIGLLRENYENIKQVIDKIIE